MDTQIYSIKDELHILRKFIDLGCGGDKRCYTEEEISAAEERLRYKLPAPVRELYLYMADALLEMSYLEPLELLHWEQNYLGLFTSPEADCIWGICRKDDPNALYKWEQYFPEEAENELLDYLEEFEEYGVDQDEEKQALAMKYSACWNRINARYTDAPPYLKKLEHQFRYNCCLDAYGLFLVIHTLCAYGTELYCLEKLNCYRGDFSDEWKGEEYSAAYFKKLREKIEQEFVPITTHMELIDITPLPMAYIHKTGNALLLCEEWSDGLTLLTTDNIDSDFIEAVQKQLGLLFRIVKRP